jgi:hypothetical protein
MTTPLPRPSATPHLRDLLADEAERPTLEALRARKLEFDANTQCQHDWACYLPRGHEGRCARD